MVKRSRSVSTKKQWSQEAQEHLHVISDISIRDKRLFNHVNFSYCDGESKNASNKLYNYGAYVLENVKYSNLDDAKMLELFRYVAKYPHCEAQGIETVQVSRNG